VSRNFDGLDDLINFGTNVLHDNLGPLTFALWVNPVNGGESNLGFMMAIQNDLGGYKIFRFNNTVAGRTQILIDGSTDISRITNNSGLLPFNKWTFASATWTGSNLASDVHIYYNAVEQSYAVSTSGAGIVADSGGNLLIGNNTGTTRTFNGQIAYAHVYNRILSIEEMKQIMFYPGSIINGLVSFNPLLGSASTEPDFSGNKNNGTVTGAIKGTTEPSINGLFTIPHPNFWYSAFSTEEVANYYRRLSILNSTKLSVVDKTKVSILQGA